MIGYTFTGIMGYYKEMIDYVDEEVYGSLDMDSKDWDEAVATNREEVIDHIKDVIIDMGNRYKDKFDYIVAESHSNTGDKVLYIYNCFSRRYDYDPDSSYKYCYNTGDAGFTHAYKPLHSRNLI